MREITNVALLDLTGMSGADALNGLSAIKNVATILVPESLLGKLLAVSMENVAATVPIPDGKRTRVLSGQIVLSGEALAGGDNASHDILIAAGQLVITSPVERVGALEIMVIGQLIAPHGSEAALGAMLTRMSGQALYYPYSPGTNVKVLTGSTRLSGADMANPAGTPEDLLVVIGSLLVTSPIERLGYQQIVAIGAVTAPLASEAALVGRVNTLGSSVVYYSAQPRVFESRESFAAAFFELLDEPITMIVHGRATFEADVTPELLKAKVAEIVLNGRIEAPRKLVPMLQVLTPQRNGRIAANDDDDAS
jgi:hypothetical protein